MKSCSALGPSLSVILLVSSFEIGFSIYHDSCLISLLTILSLFFPLLSAVSGEIENGSSGSENFSISYFFENWKLPESIESSTIYSHGLKFATFRVDPRSLPGKKVLKFNI